MIDTKTLAIFSGALKANLDWERWKPEYEAWEKCLPEEFALAGCAGHPECPAHHESVKPLVFRKYRSVPGLYYANL